MPVQNFETFNTNTDTTTTTTLLHEIIPLTGTVISGTYGTFPDETNIKNYSHGMFQSVYDYPYLSSSANHILDITMGYDETSPLSASTSTQNAKKINLFMSFVVLIRIQLEGDSEVFRDIIDQYRRDCLANEPGMEQFLVCSMPDDEQGFMLVEVFIDQEAHQAHSQGKELGELLQTMQGRNMQMGVMMMGGEEIQTAGRPVLN